MDNHKVLQEIAAEYEQRTGERLINHIANPTATQVRIAFADSHVALGYAEAVIHAASILTKLPR